jgi:hypothetical protein
MLGQSSVLPSLRRLVGKQGILKLSWRWLGHEAHLLAIPTLAAPAQAFGIDDASAGAAAPWIV